MNSSARSWPLLAALLGLMMALTACYPVRLEADWPGLRTIGDAQNILLTYNDRIVMIDPTDGKPVELRNPDGEVRLDDQGNPRVWEFMPEGTGPNHFFANPILLDEETLLAVGYDFKIYEIDLVSARLNQAHQVTGYTDESGNRVGRSGTGVGGIADPVLNNDQLYLGLNVRNLLAVDVPGFTQEWEAETQHGVWSAPVIVDDVMYFTSLDHNLYAVNPDTGEEIWRLDLQGAAPSAPLVYKDHLYVGSFARKVFKISLDGEIVDEFSTGDWVWGTPAIVDDVLYVGDMSGNLYAQDVSGEGFEPVWEQKIAARGIRATPLINGDYVIVGARDHKVYWVNREDGSVVFSREVAGEVLSDLLLIEPSETVDIPEPYVVVSSVANNELLVAFTLENGEREWTYGR